VFNKMASGDVVTWNAMIGTCAMWARTPGCISPNATGRCTTFVCIPGVLNACADVVALEEGRRAHEQTI
jgi:hypothetical protein